MQRRSFIAAGCAAAIPLIAPIRASAGGAIVVYAAASLREAFEAMRNGFAAKSGVSITFNFGGSDTLATQIEQGAPADVFASANTAQMTRLAGAGLTLGQPATFARNRIVAIVPSANPGRITRLADLARPGIRLVMTPAAVPIGAYARTAFATMEKRGELPGGRAAVEANVVSQELDVKAVATKVALGEADAGIVYATDAAALGARVRTFDFPRGDAPEATYPIAALRGSHDPDAARAFVAYVLREGQITLRARGFLPA